MNIASWQAVLAAFLSAAVLARPCPATGARPFEPLQPIVGLGSRLSLRESSAAFAERKATNAAFAERKATNATFAERKATNATFAERKATNERPTGYQPPRIVGVRVGLADRYKAGLWTRVEVVCEGGSEATAGELAVIAPDSDGLPGRAARPCRLRPGEKTVVSLVTRLGRVHGELSVELRAGGRLLAERTFATGSQADGDHFLPALEVEDLIVTVGGSDLGVEGLAKLHGDPQSAPVAAALDGPGDLPADWLAYEGVKAVVLATNRWDAYRGLAADDPRIAALDEWIHMGGRLVLSVGSRAADALGPKSPLRRFAPGRLQQVITLHQIGALESYCGSGSGTAGSESDEGGMPIAWLRDVQGTVEARDADVPLVVRTARGFGQVIFFVGDLGQPPLAAWADRPLLLARLVDLNPARLEEAGQGTAMLHRGYDDLAGQLRSALDRFEGVRLAPFWLVAGLLIVYLLAVGPGDFLLLRSLARRMEWTWLTFPLAVALVSVAAYALACGLKGGRICVHQADLVDVDAASGRVRGATWLNVLSPRTEAFTLSAAPQRLDPARPAGEPLTAAREWMAWFGLTGSGLGGMDARTQATLFGSAAFRYSARRDALQEVPIQIWSTKSFTARWAGRTAVCPAAELSEADQLLTGPITNTLAFPLKDCIVAHGGSVYEIGTLRPGESVQLGPMARRSELKTLLTGRRTVQDSGEKFHQEATPYDQASTDIPYILRMMMFYEAAGGRRHVGLWNAYQDFVDLSSLLRADRAILLAQQPVEEESHQGAALLRDGRPLAVPHGQHITLYRFVFPVKQEKSGE